MYIQQQGFFKGKGWNTETNIKFKMIARYQDDFHTCHICQKFPDTCKFWYYIKESLKYLSKISVPCCNLYLWFNRYQVYSRKVLLGPETAIHLGGHEALPYPKGLIWALKQISSKVYSSFLFFSLTPSKYSPNKVFQSPPPYMRSPYQIYVFASLTN